ncbi:CTP synthase C-terminal region-related (seleno)protein [Spirochaeta cellobiosiphila]|uniref:CTP synthase C-terminal region-related (seleno)protein n=1 Tax=Spirochaeta cellobiosiphila TaxID=504483 RepID=UPI00041B3364|nr:hypothetical protein [Spirochaeta cellobiosiphila]
MIKFAVIGEYQDDNQTHILLEKSLEEMSSSLGKTAQIDWIDTKLLDEEGSSILLPYHGIWSAPGSPFHSLEGAISGIRYARENLIPHLGTCAGFQHSVIEIARNLLGYTEAQHEEYDHESSVLFISKLQCSLKGKTMTVHIKKGSQAFALYGKALADEDYYCNFGINPDFRPRLNHPDVLISGVDDDNEIRILELGDHPFFISTLFVPQSRWTLEHPHPLIKGFVEAASVMAE